MSNNRYNWNAGDLLGVITITGNANVDTDRKTYVYKHNGTEFVLDTSRTVGSVAINNAFDKTTTAFGNTILYDGKDRQTSLQLEVYDPPQDKFLVLLVLQILLYIIC